MKASRAHLKLRPIDDRARDGDYRMVFGQGQFAVARWIGGRWAFSSGADVPWPPESYRLNFGEPGATALAPRERT